jgi:hypothetical protein
MFIATVRFNSTKLRMERNVLSPENGLRTNREVL